MSRLRTILGLGLISTTLLLGAACGGEETAGPASDESDVTSLVDLYRDGRNLDLSDLLATTAGFATDALNDTLASSDYAAVQIAPTELYALAADAQGDATLQDLDALATGLAARFGERELTTHVTALRRSHLASSDDDVYAESAFKVRAGIHDWGVSAGGFGDASARVGFDASAELEARVVRAFRREGSALVGAPLAAAKEARGFVAPRTVADLKALAPGETFALRGKGVVGLNLGVGVPILLASPGTLSYRVVLSAGVRTRLEGTLDVQLVRLDGDAVVVDVGVEQASLKEMRVGLEDGWGVVGLVQKTVELGGRTIDLGQVVDKAFQKQLNAKLNLVEASLEKTQRRSRLSVARLRFSLDQAQGQAGIEKAIAAALRADVRLAQALANARTPGVEVEFELSRSGVSGTSYAGIDVFGMSFFRKQAASEGSVTIETPGGTRTILFDSLHRESGWFFSSHGYARTALSGLVFDPDDPGAGTGEANLVVQLLEGDDFMERDKLLDHLDGVIRAMAGADALAAIAAPGDDLERQVRAACASQDASTCGSAVLRDPAVAALRKQGQDALEAHLGGLDPELREVVRAAGALRLTAQATLEPAAQLVGPPTSVVVDYRIDDAALSGLFATDPERLGAAAVAHLAAVGIKRHDTPAKQASRADEIAREVASTRAALTKLFAERAEEYDVLVSLERRKLDGHPELGALGPRAVAVDLPLKDGKPDYASAALHALPHRRARIATALFDGLVEAAKKSGEHPEEVAGYALLSLLDRAHLDVRLQVQMDVGDSWAQGFDHYREAGYQSLDVYGRGRSTAPIDGGLFSIDDLVDVDQ